MQTKKEIHQADFSKVAKNAGITGFGDIFQYGFRYITNIIITRFLGSASFGIFVLSYAFLNISQVISSLGLNQVVLRYISFYQGKDDNSRIKGTILTGSKIVFISSIIFSIIIFFMANFIALNIFHKPEAETPIKIMILALPFLAIKKIFLSMLQGFHSIKYQIYIEKILQPFIWLVFLVCFLFLGWGINGLIGSLAVSIIFGVIFALYYLLKIWGHDKRNVEPVFENEQLIKYSLPLLFSGLLGQIITWAVVFLLGRFRSVSEVGIYESGVRVAALIIFPLTAFNNIFSPMISELHSQNAWDRIESLFKVVTKWIFTLSFPIFLLLLIFAKPIMNIFGKDFVLGAPVLIIIGLGQLINAGTGSVGYVLTMTGHQNIVLLNSIILCIINIILGLFLIPDSGIIGAAISACFSISFVNVLRLIEVYYFLKIHPYKLNFWKSLTAGIISAGIYYWLINNFIYKITIIYLILFSSLFIITYVFLIYLFKLDEEDKYVLERLMGKLKFTKK
ncbi:MAG: flippase [Candidatus Firestonebacteria bacterium]|nr:flippase [Candidatus Firestonebacteria bacterium]